MNELNAYAWRRFCAVCGRRIKNKKSVSNGIGPKCLKKLRQTERRQILLFDDEWEDSTKAK
jgi:predicted nucleic acid-binding Zn ribbon protein